MADEPRSRLRDALTPEEITTLQDVMLHEPVAARAIPHEDAALSLARMGLLRRGCDGSWSVAWGMIPHRP